MLIEILSNFLDELIPSDHKIAGCSWEESSKVTKIYIKAKKILF